jgi:hypothetical protein
MVLSTVQAKVSKRQRVKVYRKVPERVLGKVVPVNEGA